MKIYKNIIIGGGASGLMFVANLKDKQNSLIIENNPELGAKLLISGGGRCNFTNKIINSNFYHAKKSFIKNLLKEYSSGVIYQYFTEKGVETMVKNENEYFCKNSSKDILNTLKKEIKNCNIKLNTKVTKIKKRKTLFEIVTNNGSFFTKNLIVASGGLSFPKLGATNIGYKIAKKFKHTINTTSPALVGFTLQSSESFFKELSGVSIEVKLSIGKKILKGSMLFTHRGVSGPVILNASLFWQKGFIYIDFLPNFNLNRIKNYKKSISNSLPLPKRVAKALLNRLNLEDKKINLLSKDEFNTLQELKNYKFAPTGTFGYTKAEVTKGGINIDEIDVNFQSKLEDNLFFIGEVLDITGALGGYNFHFAFSSALKCANYINKLNTDL